MSELFMGMDPDHLLMKIEDVLHDVSIQKDVPLGPISESYFKLACAALEQAKQFAALSHIARMRKD
jgi:hypothetical protein